MRISDTIEKCKAILTRHYGSQFQGLVLYGSAARGHVGVESDLDLLVLLREPLDYFRELRCIIDLLYPVQIETDHLISANPAPVDAFMGGDRQLYRNAKKEGRFYAANA
jgi:predicted nucleotidyltransferase